MVQIALKVFQNLSFIHGEKGGTHFLREDKRFLSL